MRDAPYFVLPYVGIVALNFVVSSLSAAYWASTAVSAAQLLRLFLVRASWLHLYAPVWFRTGVLYGLIAMIFVVLLNIQSLLAMIWVVGTKWAILGRRNEGPCSWDKSSYCEHRVLVDDWDADMICRPTMANSPDPQPPAVSESWHRRCSCTTYWFCVHRLVLGRLSAEPRLSTDLLIHCSGFTVP